MKKKSHTPARPFHTVDWRKNVSWKWQQWSVEQGPKHYVPRVLESWNEKIGPWDLCWFKQKHWTGFILLFLLFNLCLSLKIIWKLFKLCCNKFFFISVIANTESYWLQKSIFVNAMYCKYLNMSIFGIIYINKFLGNLSLVFLCFLELPI